nr:hypothetical protein [uncultured Solibaculum sp.]
MEKEVVSKEQYDAVAQELRQRHGYDDMSDEEREAFDAKLDQVIEVDDKSTDQNDTIDPSDSADDEEGEAGIGAKVLRRTR